MPVIHWFRRDLRLDDNTALHHALMSGEPVVPLFILDDFILARQIPGERLRLLRGALEDLDARLRERGSRLLVRRGDAAREMNHVAEEVESWGVYFNRDYTPYARQRDTRATRGLQMTGVVTQVFDDPLLVSPYAMVEDSGLPSDPDAFVARWLEALDVEPEAPADPEGGHLAAGADLPESLKSWADVLAPAGAAPGDDPAASAGAAREALRRFVAEGLVGFDGDDLDGGELPWLATALRLGTISPREAARGVLRRAAADARARPGAERFIRALALRDFDIHWLYADPTGARHT